MIRFQPSITLILQKENPVIHFQVLLNERDLPEKQNNNLNLRL